MLRNLDGSHGLVFSHRLLLALVESGLPRDEAYRLVQRNAMQAWDEERDFRALVEADAEITARLDRGRARQRLRPRSDRPARRHRASTACTPSPEGGARPCLKRRATSRAARSARSTPSTTSGCCSSPATGSRRSTSCCRPRSPTRAASSPGSPAFWFAQTGIDRPEPPARAAARTAARPSAGGSRCSRSSASSAATSPAPAGRTTSRPARSAATGSRPGSSESDRLPEPIFTPATKAQTGHDENIDRAAAVALVGEERFDEVERLTLELYRFVSEPRARARDHPRRHEARVRASTATGGSCSPTRRSRPTRRASGRPTSYEPGGAAAVVRQAVRARLLRDARLGQDLPRPGAARRRRRRHARPLRRGVRAPHRRSTSTTTSPIPASVLG